MLDPREPQDGAGRSGEPVELLVLELGAQRYALDVRSVDELVRAVSLVTLPRAPAIVEGIIDVRGTLVPVLDLRRRLGQAPRAPHPSDHLVLARAGERRVALRCDRAVSLLRVDPRDVEDARAAVPGLGHVDGVVRLPDGMVLIHDLRTFLSLDEGAALDAALAAPGGRPAGSPVPAGAA